LLGELTNEEIIAQIRSNEKDEDMEELKKMKKSCASFISFKRLF